MAILTSPRTLDDLGAKTGKKHSQRPSTPPNLLRRALDMPLASLYLLLGSAGLILGLGALMVLSASSVYAEVTMGDPYYFVKRHMVFMVVGLFGAWLISRLSPRGLRALAWPSLLMAAVMLLLTFTPLGRTVGGNRNWVEFGTSLLRFQPSEFAKAAIVLWGADQLARKEKLLDRPKELIPYLLFSGILIGLVVLQHDAGTALIMGVMVLLVLFLIGAPLRLLGLFFAGAGIAALGLVLTSANRMRRVFLFLDPHADDDVLNSQPIRAIYSMASGGWWGVGLGQSRQKWGMLSQAHSDYVFAIVGEELGLVGSLTVIALFTTLIYTAFRIARRSDDPFSRNLAIGVGAWFLIQSTVNIAMVISLLPVIGVPLPFVSYGGSSLLANMAALGLLLRCARNEPAARRSLAKRDKTPTARVTAVVDGRR